MIHTGVTVLVYALAAAASPLVLTATFVVIRSRRPRTNGISFLAGFVLGTAVACGLGLVVGAATVSRLDAHEAVEESLELVLGLILLAFGLRWRHAPPAAERRESAPTPGIMARLGRVGPATSFATAGLLGFGGPKRLLLTLLAMAAVSGAHLRDAEDLTLVALYLVVATALVWAPVGVVVIAGERAAVILGRGESWLTTHAAALRVWLSIGVGAVLSVHALVRLLT